MHKRIKEMDIISYQAVKLELSSAQEWRTDSVFSEIERVKQNI